MTAAADNGTNGDGSSGGSGGSGGASGSGSELTSLVTVLGASVERLAALVKPLTPQQLRQQAYPTEWTVADVLSHLGSGAEITRLRLDGDVDMQAIWDEWNAKDPDTQAADLLRADAELQARLATLTAEDQERMRFAMGPMDLDLLTYLGLRLNEHSLHTWDVAVVFDADATLPDDEAALIVDTLPMMAGFAGKPTGADQDLSIRTVSPGRNFALALRPDGVALAPGDSVDGPDLELPADALIRLVFGRLDPDHSPATGGGAADLDALRQAFPGF
jgi:uncharacterized protein (TIGR03083 family)